MADTLSEKRPFNAQAYGWFPDGEDHSTAAQQLLTDIYAFGGGTVYFPPSTGTYRCDSQILIPNDSSSPQPNQPNIRFTGAGGGQNWYNLPTNGGGVTSGWPGASIIDLRYTGTGAKFQTLGRGVLKLDNLTIQDGGTSNTTPIFLTTNTTVAIRDNTFIGSGNVGQDAIVLGGPNRSIGGAITDGFQGYGTNILCNHFTKLNRGLYTKSYANSISFCFNSFMGNIGTTAIEVADVNNCSHNYIGNLIEMDVYAYGFFLGAGPLNGKFIGNDFWDTGNTHVADFYINGNASAQSIFILGRHEDASKAIVANIGGGGLTSLAGSTVLGSYTTLINSSLIKMQNLPISDPHIVGQLWASNGVVMVSSG